MENIKHLITGSGFISSHLNKKLKNSLMIDVTDGYDIRDYPAIETIFEEHRPETITHLAAHHPLKLGERNPVGSAMINIVGTLNLLLLAKKYNCKFIYVSTGAIYGNIDSAEPVKEEGTFYPESFYGVSKLAAEQYVLHFAKKRELEAMIVRFSSVYGPRRREGPINQMLEAAMKTGNVTIYGDGEITRDYTYIDDVIDGLLLCVKGEVPFDDIYNIASGVETSLNQVVKAISKVVGAVITEYQEERLGDIKRNYFDISKISQFGYSPKIDINEGIRRLFDELQD